MIRLRNLDVGSGRFNGSRLVGTAANPFAVSTDSPMLDMQDINWSMTTGWTGIRMTLKQITTAQASGTNYVARFRAENNVNTSIGTLVGLDVNATNNNTSASLVAIGLAAAVGMKGLNLSDARGIDVVMDNTTGTGTISTMQGIRKSVV